MPSDIIRGAGKGARERGLVDSPFRILLVRLCSSLLPCELCRFVIYPVNVTMDLEGSRAGDDGRRRRRSDGTRPGARDVAFPSSRSQLGMRAGDDCRRRRRSDSTRPGAWDVAFPSSRSQLGMRAGDDGRWR